MGKSVDLEIDVSESAQIGITAHTAVTVVLPEVEDMPTPPIVCFAFPGGGYSRGYFTFDMPDSIEGGEAGWHAARGWIVVACDHLGVGGSTVPEGTVLDFNNIARGNKATVEAVMATLEAGTLDESFPPIVDAVKIGIGQSMGGNFLLVLQGQHQVFDGIASLGYSAIHTVVPSRPGTPQAAWPWMLRGSDLGVTPPLNAEALAAAAAPTIEGEESLAAVAELEGEHPFRWAFHYDDEPEDIVSIDLADPSELADGLPSWRSATTPPCAIFGVAPGAVATEAASITVPILAAMGERDVVPNPWMEPFAFRSSRDITLFVCEGMAHMHNFANTRHRFWTKIHSWGDGVAALGAEG